MPATVTPIGPHVRVSHIPRDFYDFCAALRCQTKDYGEIYFCADPGEPSADGVKRPGWKGTQRYFFEQVFEGIANGTHAFVVLKGRQQGISTACLALDLYWLFKYPGLAGSLVTQDEQTRDEFRATLTMYVDGLPQRFKVPLVTNNRTHLVARNRSRFSYQVAGTKKNTKLGKGKGLTYIHGTEVGEWGDEEGFASLQASMSETHPRRLEIYESTAQGFNFFSDLWDTAVGSVSMKAIFIGWWRNDAYRKPEGSNEYRVYWEASPKLAPDERQWVKDIEEEYGDEPGFQSIDGEQMAWYRWTQCEKMNDDADVMFQNHPPTAKYAFIASGENFFSTARLSDEMKRIRKAEQPDLFRFVLRDKWEECDITETIAKHTNLWVWQHADPQGLYVLGADPAYGSSDWADRFCASVWRCYADGMEQVAEFCTDSCNTYQFAWVVLYLAGYYKNTNINLEINGPGQAVWQEIQSLRRQAAMTPKSPVSQTIMTVLANLQNYLYKRIDSFGRPTNYHTVTTNQIKERMLNFYKDSFERGQSIVRSAGLIEEMQAVVRDDGQLGAPNRKKDDRVMAAGLGHVAWSDWVRGQCIQRGLLRPVLTTTGEVKPIVGISTEMKGWLARRGVGVTNRRTR